MRYEKYTIKSNVSAEDIISAELSGLGIEGVEISDSNLPEEDGVPVYIDDMPDNPLKNGEALISFYLDADMDNTELVNSVKDMLRELSDTFDIGPAELVSETTEDKDWLNSWKDYFHQFTLDFEDGSSALFIPSWEKSETDTSGYDLVINTDPGTAFGTGAHETTALCIKALHKYIKKDDVLADIGTGSGILAVAALKFGASKAYCTDIDPNADAAVVQNMENNQIDNDSLVFIRKNILTDVELTASLTGKADIMTANILPDVLIPLFPIARKILKKDSIFIVSGVIDTKAGLIRQELENNDFRLLEETSMGEWFAFVAKNAG